MAVKQSSYSADIEVTVDGWTLEPEDTENRRPEPAPEPPAATEPRGIAQKKRLAALMWAVSGNRRVERPRKESRRAELDRTWLDLAEKKGQ